MSLFFSDATVVIARPSPCTASSHAISVKAFRWRTRWDHVARNVIAARNNWGSFSIDDSNDSDNVIFKMNSHFFQSLSGLFQFAESGKCKRISLELISWGPHSSLGREKEIRRRLFTSSIKHAIRHFHVVVVQGRKRNVQKSVMHVQSCCFA